MSPDTGTATLEAPAAEAEASPSAVVEESASPASNDTTPQESAHMNALLRGALPADRDSASKPTTDEDNADTAGQDGASAPTGDVKPSETPGRRGAAAEIAHLRAENARLQKAYEEANPPPPDASEEARAKAIETETRFRRLLVKPESDSDWTHEDIAFLEGEKQRRALVPELSQHYEAVIEADRQALAQEHEAKVAGFWAHVRADMASARDVPGVDFEAVKAARTFAERDRLMYAAGQAASEPELKKLREENADLRRDLFGAVRAPVQGGRSAPGRTFSENDYMNTLLRGGRR